MKLPLTPPDMNALQKKIGFERLLALDALLSDAPPAGDYWHWDRLIHLPPPGDVTHEEWWVFLKGQRRALYKNIPLSDAQGKPFRFAPMDPIPEQTHRIDQGAGGRIGVSAPVIDPETKDQYHVSSLIEEAITSSQLEGAATTRKVAKEMLLTQRPPNDRSERMIFNNFMTMRHVTGLREEPLTPGHRRPTRLHRAEGRAAAGDGAEAAWDADV